MGYWCGGDQLQARSVVVRANSSWRTCEGVLRHGLLSADGGEGPGSGISGTAGDNEFPGLK